MSKSECVLCAYYREQMKYWYDVAVSQMQQMTAMEKRLEAQSATPQVVHVTVQIPLSAIEDAVRRVAEREWRR